MALAATFLAGPIYLPTLSYDFVWDDEALVVDNAELDTRSPLRFFSQGFMHEHKQLTGEPVRYYRPLVAISLWLDHAVWGKRPLGYHLTNVILNVVACLLFSLTLWRLFRVGRADTGSRDDVSWFWPVTAGGVAFALHPMHTESVAFVSGRTDILSAVFVLGSLLAVLRFRETRSWKWLALVAVGFGAALLSKENVILLPLLAGLLSWSATGQSSVARRFAPAAVLAALAVAYLVLRFQVLGGFGVTVSDVGPGQQAMLVLNALGRYAFLSCFPFLHRILFADAVSFAAFGWPTLLGIIGIIGVLLVFWRFTRSVVAIGGAWFLLFVLPASNVVPIGSTLLAERALYLPVAGFAIVLAAAIARLSPRVLQRGGLVMTSAFIVAMGWSVLARMPVWRDSLALYKTMARETPGLAGIHSNLGVAHKKAGNFDAAVRELTEATRLDPGHALARLNLGDVLRAKGDLAEAREQYVSALRIEPRMAEAYHGLGLIWGQEGTIDSALHAFRVAVLCRPEQAEFRVNLGNSYAMSGMPDSASHHFWAAIELRPDHLQAYENLEKLYRWLGKPDSAAQVRRLMGESFQIH